CMPGPSDNLNTAFTQRLTITINRWLDANLLDLFSSHHPVFYRLRERGNIVAGGLGVNLIEPIFYPSTTGPQVAGVTDSWNPITHSETGNISAAQYTPAEYLLPVSISDYDLDLQGSDTMKVNYAESIMKISVAKFLEKLNSDIWAAEGVTGSDGSSRTTLGSLRTYFNGGGSSTTSLGTPAAISEQLVAAVGSAPLTSVGGIQRNAANAAYWCTPLINPGSAATISLEIVNNIISAATRNNDVPDLVILPRKRYDTFMSILQGYQRYTESKLADAGFEAMRYRGADIIFDDNVPTAAPGYNIFAINTKYLKLRCKTMKPQFVMVTDPQRPIRAWLARWVGQLTSGNLGRVHCRHCNIA
ncbi:MAG TPA: phage major capsid protein, partial [Chthonomonadales bacterium]|nr:phage major capsid protein [Chthonomonadales bacterium]